VAAPVAEAAPYGGSDAEVTPLPPNLTAEWLPAAARLRTALGATGRNLVSLIAWGLGRDASLAASRFRPDDSTLRILDYPDAEQLATGPLRAAEHEDSGALTFIWSDAPGLQLLTAQGDWGRGVPGLVVGDLWPRDVGDDQRGRLCHDSPGASGRRPTPLRGLLLRASSRCVRPALARRWQGRPGARSGPDLRRLVGAPARGLTRGASR
jgi:hypothetical protein